MKRIAILLAEGFEEGEALFPLDVLRRAGMQAELVGVTGETVTGAHGVRVETDRPMGEDLGEYDMVVLPGGLPGATNLRDDERVLRLVRSMFDQGREVAAICAAPIALAKAGILAGRRLTSYPEPSFLEKFADAQWVDEPVVIDGNLTTAQGPAMALPFGFALAEKLGGDSAPLKEGMLYNRMLREQA